MDSKVIPMMAILTAIVIVSSALAFAQFQVASAGRNSANGASANGARGVGIGADANASGGAATDYRRSRHRNRRPWRNRRIFLTFFC